VQYRSFFTAASSSWFSPHRMFKSQAIVLDDPKN
jgi:hypothetical protein